MARKQAACYQRHAVADEVVHIETPSASVAATRLLGVTLLERTLRGLAREGVRRARVACEPIVLPPGLPIDVEWHPAGEPAPDGARWVVCDGAEGVAVVDAASHRRAEWALLRTLPKAHQGVIDAAINWRLSLPITRLLTRTRIRPNHVTLVATAVGLVAAACAWAGTYAAVAASGVLLQIQSVLDSCDGELARVRFQGSRLGQWLDNVTDDVVDNAYLLGLGLGAPHGYWTTVALAGVGARLLHLLATYVEVYVRTGTGDLYGFRWWFEKGKADIVDVYDRRSALTWVRALGRRDAYVFLYMLACLAGAPEAAIVFGAGLGATYLGMTAVHLAVTAARRPA